MVLKADRAPDNRTTQLFEAWGNRSDLEAKRVIYVGVTRARRLAMIALPVAFGDRCIAILERGNVPVERITLANT